MQARRAAAPDETIEGVVEIEPTRSPRRAQSSRVRIVVAPLALAAVAGILSMASVLPNAGYQTEPLGQVTSPQDISHSEIASRQVSRSGERNSLLPIDSIPTPAASAAPSPSATRTVDATAAPSAPEAPVSSAPAAPEEAALTLAPAAREEAAPASTPAPAPTPTPAAAAAAPKPAPAIPALGSDAGTLYVTDSVNVRNGPGKGHDSLTVLSAGSTVTATDVVVDGWQQVNRKGNAGWVRASFLSTDEPVAKVAEKSPEKSSGAKSDATCSKAGDLESKLTQRTVEVLRSVCANFPGVSSYGGYRAGDSGYHGSGQAIDVMISGDAGWEIAKWARSNASDLGVVEVIYEQKIWTTQRSGDGWRSMSDRGSVSANHYDHVHLSVR